MKIFLRTTSNKAGKFRPDWFSYEACFKSLVPRKQDELVVFFDGDPDTVPDYISYKIVFAKDGGSETKSFRSLFEYLKENEFDPEEIVYIVEDDYLHRPGGLDALEDVLKNTNVDYATLYDHADKYFTNYFEKFAFGFKTLLFHTEKSHWRTTPSTTNTFAAKYKTLMEDLETHMKFSPTDEKTSRDHEKFHELWSNGRTLVSSVPGLSTHVENSLMSPCFDWSNSSPCPTVHCCP
jgi:glycosyltransferase involved in cell wall biosynthesis